jgi:hypothetical protein
MYMCMCWCVNVASVLVYVLEGSIVDGQPQHCSPQRKPQHIHIDIDRGNIDLQHMYINRGTIKGAGVGYCCFCSCPCVCIGGSMLPLFISRWMGSYSYRKEFGVKIQKWDKEIVSDYTWCRKTQVPLYLYRHTYTHNDSVI